MWSSSAASSSSQRSSSDVRCSSALWRRRGLRLQAVPHCRLPTSAAFLHKYELGTQLGRGNFGTVWEARERSTGRSWAAKVVAKSSVSTYLTSGTMQRSSVDVDGGRHIFGALFLAGEIKYLSVSLCVRICYLLSFSVINLMLENDQQR